MAAQSLPSIVVFGSQTTWPSSLQLVQLRAVLLRDPHLLTFLTAIRGLPALWETLVGYDARLKQVPGLKSLNAIQRWVEDGILVSSRIIPPNVLSTPLTTIIHIAQYFHYLKSNDCGATHSLILENAQLGGVQGLCTGILSAIAVACSESEDAIGKHASVALRLAVCIGAYVDLEGAFGNPPNEMLCCIVRQKPELNKDNLLEILQSYPDVCMTFGSWITSFSSY